MQLMTDIVYQTSFLSDYSKFVYVKELGEYVYMIHPMPRETPQIMHVRKVLHVSRLANIEGSEADVVRLLIIKLRVKKLF